MGRQESRMWAQRFIDEQKLDYELPPVVEELGIGRPMSMTPEELFIHFQAYRVDKKATPFLVQDFGMTKEGAQMVLLEKEKPLTLESFIVWLWEKNIHRKFRDVYDNRLNLYCDFAEICSYIREVIRADQIEGGMSNVYNNHITQRLNNLSEKTITETTVKQFKLTMNLK